MINLVAKRETHTGLPPRENLSVDISGDIVALHIGSIESDSAFAAVIAERKTVGSLAARAFEADIMLARGSGAEQNACHVPVCIVEGAGAVLVHIVVAHIVPVLELAHFAITARTAVLLFPCLGIRHQLVEVHTEKLVGDTGTVVGLHKSAELLRHRRIFRQHGRTAPREVVRIFY